MNTPMTPRAPWLGWCHLHRSETSEDFETHAAVLCETREDFDAVLRDHAKSLGLILMWTQDVRPAMEWLKLNPKFIGTGGNLARAVHPGNKVELGQLTAMEMPDDPNAEPPEYLLIEEIEVEPLDAQTDIWPKKTVPDALAGPLFGEDEPTEAEIEAYGSIEAVPPLRTYAVLDAAKMPYLLLSHMEGSGLGFRSLYQGEAEEELKQAAPYLIELTQDNAFTRALMTGPKGINGLWEKNLAFYLRSRASFKELRRHLRKFTRIRDRNDKWYYFRFWEPASFPAYAKALKHDKRSTCLTRAGNHLVSFLVPGQNDAAIIVRPDAALAFKALPQTFFLGQAEWDALAEAEKAKSATKLRLYLEERQPGFRAMAEDNRQTFVTRAIAAAAQFNLTVEQAVADFAEAALILNRDPGKDPDCRKILTNQDPQLSRARAILQLSRAEKTEGE